MHDEGPLWEIEREERGMGERGEGAREWKN